MYEGAQGLYMRQLGFMHRILQCFTWDRCHAWSTRVSCTRPGVLLWALSSLLYTFPACSLPPSFARACLDNSAFSHFSDLLWETFPKFTYSELHSSPSTPLLNCLKALESLHILLVLVSFSHFFFLGNTWELIFFFKQKRWRCGWNGGKSSESLCCCLHSLWEFCPLSCVGQCFMPRLLNSRGTAPHLRPGPESHKSPETLACLVLPCLSFLYTHIDTPLYSLKLPFDFSWEVTQLCCCRF